MTTTAVFAEILVLGLQAVAWLALAVAIVIDPGPALSALEPWATLVTIMVLAGAYVLGVLVDRVADSIAGSFRRSGSSKASLDDSRFRSARRRLLSKDTPLASFMEYQRSRLRLTRGTALNSVLAIPVTNVFLFSAGLATAPAIIGANALLLGLLAASVYAHAAIRKAHDGWMNDPSQFEEDVLDHGPEKPI